MDNGTQFIDKMTKSFLEELKIKKHFASVEHPQTNGQDEATNRVLVRGKKWRLEEASGNQADELPHMLWAYCTTPQSTMEETPFLLTYDVETIILGEFEELSWRTTNSLQEKGKGRTIKEETGLLEEKMMISSFTSIVIKQTTTSRYDRCILPREFKIRDLVLQIANIWG